MWLCSCPSGLLKYIHNGKILPDVSNYNGTCSDLGPLSGQPISLQFYRCPIVSISTVAQKYPDRTPGFQFCNHSYQNDHHLGAVAEQWVGSPSSDYWSGAAWNLAGCTHQLCAFLLHFHRDPGHPALLKPLRGIRG